MNTTKINMKLFLLALIIQLIFTNNSYSYIDPGSTSIILQVIAGFVAGLAATFKLWVYKVKLLFKKISGYLGKETK